MYQLYTYTFESAAVVLSGHVPWHVLRVHESLLSLVVDYSVVESSKEVYPLTVRSHMMFSSKMNELKI